VLFGEDQQRSFQLTVVQRQNLVGTPLPRPTTTTVLRQASGSDEETVPMADFEIGVEWSRSLGRAGVSVQTGLVSRTWFGVGDATGGDGALGFLGVRISAGVSY
jgi:hypothetical protein